MTNDDWQQAIYAALGIPAAVTDKAAMASELLERKFSPPAGATGDTVRTGRRTAARNAVLAELPACLGKGELDRLLVDLEDIEMVATRVADMIGAGHASDDVLERKAILHHILPGLLSLARGPVGRARLPLPAALRPYLLSER